MANLNLTHSGNMNITSASIGPGGTLDVQYEPNNSGGIIGSGWTHNQREPLVCGDTYTILLYPQFSGTVLSETFVVSGYDEAGIRRSDTSVLKQGFNSDLRDYIREVRSTNVRMDIHSSSVTENYIEVNATVVGYNSGYRTSLAIFWTDSDSTNHSVTVWFDVEREPIPTAITSLNVVVPDEIIDYGQASAVYTPSSATVNLVYSLQNNDGEATIDPVTGEITVLTNGDVWVCVTDTISNLSSCKNVIVTSSDEPSPDTGITGNTFCVYYNVTSTTEPTWIGSYAYDISPSQFVSARLVDGTDVPLVVDNGAMFFTFPETGVQRVFYTVTSNSIPNGAFCYHPEQTPYPVTSLIGVETYEDITGIGGDAFFHIGSLRSLIIPNVTYVGTDTFLGCTGLTGDLVLPDSFERAYYWAFEGCTGLTSITFPSSFAYLYGEAFGNCSSLTAVTFLGEVPPSIVTSEPYYVLPFGTNRNFPIYVPCQSLMAYREAFPYYADQIRCSGEIVTALTLSVAEDIIENGVAIPIISPEVYQPLFEFTSSNPEIATIDSGGNITVLNNGQVTFCVTELGSGLSDCKTVRARKAVYIDSITEILPDVVFDTATARTSYTPSNGTVSLVYTSSDPDIASIDQFTGEIVAHKSGSATITVRDIFTNKTLSKTVRIIKTIASTIEATYYITSTTVGTKVTSNSVNTIITKIYLENGTVIPLSSSSSYVFPETGYTKVFFEVNYNNITVQTPMYFNNIPALIDISYPSGSTRVRYTILPYNCNSLVSIYFPKTVNSIAGDDRKDVITGTSLKYIYSFNRTAPTIYNYQGGSKFGTLASNGTLYYPSGTNYSSWLNNLPSSWSGSSTL